MKIRVPKNKRPRKRKKRGDGERGKEPERDEGEEKAGNEFSLIEILIPYRLLLWKQFEQSGSLRSSYGFPIFWHNGHKQSAHFSDSLIRNRENGLGGTGSFRTLFQSLHFVRLVRTRSPYISGLSLI